MFARSQLCAISQDEVDLLLLVVDVVLFLVWVGCLASSRCNVPHVAPQASGEPVQRWTSRTTVRALDSRGRVEPGVHGV